MKRLKPVPKDDEVLIKVRAASVNPLDWRLMEGTPRFVRLFSGLGKPKNMAGPASMWPAKLMRWAFALLIFHSGLLRQLSRLPELFIVEL